MGQPGGQDTGLNIKTNVLGVSARSVFPRLHTSLWSRHQPRSTRMTDTRTIEAILDLARWAPSGDNTQPWRFEIIDDAHAVVHGFDTRDHCVYDLDGRPSQMSIGALIETAAIAASAHGLQMRSVRRLDMPEMFPTFDLHFDADTEAQCDPLHEVIKQRSVERRPFATTLLSAEHKAALEASIGSEHSVRWIEGGAARFATAAMLFRSARLRLVTPEAYRVHRDVIEWGARFSVDKVPDQALGVNQAMLVDDAFCHAQLATRPVLQPLPGRDLDAQDPDGSPAGVGVWRALPAAGRQTAADG